MALASQMVAGVGVKNAAAKESGADQKIEDVKHRVAP